jgi:uncharacterized OsmC-like protein
MSEHVVVRQNRRFETEFRAWDTEDPESDDKEAVFHIHELTPHSLVLASLAACTAVLLNSYAQNHSVNLQEVTSHGEHDKEQIEEELTLSGELTDDERQKLFTISKQCSIHKLLEAGITVHSQLAERRGEK